MAASAGVGVPGSALDTTLDTFPWRLLQHARGGKATMREKDLGIWQLVADESRAMAAGLAELGFKRGDHLAIIGNNQPRLYWAMREVQMFGGIPPTPFYQDAVAAEMVFALHDAEIRIANVEDREQIDKMLEVREQCHCIHSK
jgi:long-chain acyl-CoA synthetase